MGITPGVICLWYGAIVNIPTGWVLCNGANGTPDLRNRFIVGSGNSYNPGDTGGSTTHTHFLLVDGHTHSIPSGVGAFFIPDYSDITIANTDSGTTDPSSSLPLYHSLAYIMKL